MNILLPAISRSRRMWSVCRTDILCTNPMGIGDLRRTRGLTQEELARRVRVSIRTVAAWERGESLPRQRHARALARALGVAIDDLFPANGTAIPTS